SQAHKCVQEACESYVASDMKSDLIALLPRLRRFARSLTRSVTEADDLVQEACLRALSRAHQWDPTQPLDRWMFRITRNLWISEMRKRSVRTGQGHVPAEEATELVSQETGENRVLVADVQARIAALPDDMSSLLLAVSVEGYSYAEAAELFDIPVGTVMSRIHRARKTLAGALCDSGGRKE
ncbi:MAG: RNA polymerase sigma factor, partial [Pseudomonadota bacterium]